MVILLTPRHPAIHVSIKHFPSSVRHFHLLNLRFAVLLNLSLQFLRVDLLRLLRRQRFKVQFLDLGLCSLLGLTAGNMLALGLLVGISPIDGMILNHDLDFMGRVLLGLELNPIEIIQMIVNIRLILRHIQIQIAFLDFTDCHDVSIYLSLVLIGLRLISLKSRRRVLLLVQLVDGEASPFIEREEFDLFLPLSIQFELLLV